MRKETRLRAVLRAAAWTAAAVAALWLLGPVLLPFFIGLGLARAAEPAVTLLRSRFRFPRWLAAGCAVSALYLLAGLGGFFLCRLLCRELRDFVRSLPELAAGLAGPVARLEQRLLLAASRFPDGIGAALEQGVARFFRSGAGLGQRIYDRVFQAVSQLLTKLPDLFLFLLTAVLSSFMFSAKLPSLRSLWNEHGPPKLRETLPRLTAVLKQTLGRWLAAQAKLMAVTFLILWVGLLILRTDHSLLLGSGIALLDALPVLGSGLVLIPWSLLRFLQGDTFRGAGLLLLYGVAALTRTALEPRILGRQIGLDPLLTLIALYAGYRVLGFAGMILFPLGVLLGKQVLDGREKN